MLVLEKAHAIFFHIPKTGGMSIEKAFGVRHASTHHDVPAFDPLWSSYFRFCFVRNPWDRLYSAFRYSCSMIERDVMKGHPVREMIRRECMNDFEKFVDAFLNEETLKRNLHFRPQMHWVGAARANFIGRFETLREDAEWVARALGTPIVLDHVNRSGSAFRRHELYTDTMLKRVGSLYFRDIRNLGYQFEC